MNECQNDLSATLFWSLEEKSDNITPTQNKLKVGKE